MKALHFGAGNIGRGFIGKLLADAGIQLTFADVNQVVLDALNARHTYPVHVVGEREQIEMVSGVNAVNSTSEAAVELVAEVDLITTAVGPQILERLAGNIARGLAKRCDNANNQPLNIIACENMVRGTSWLKEHVLKVLPEHYHAWVADHVGFIDSAVDRIVPPSEAGCSDPLAVTVEAFSEWIVDKTQFKGALPEIPGMELTDNLMAFVERKLFTLNTGHSIAAWLGRLAGHKTIREAILDRQIRGVVQGAMEESGAVLIKRYGFDADKHAAYIQKVIVRFENPYLQDDVGRVGRQPLRKLSAGDRLIKPTLGAQEYQLPYDNLVIGIAAALLYRNDSDAEAQQLAALLEKQDVATALAQISGLAADGTVVAAVVKAYHTIS